MALLRAATRDRRTMQRVHVVTEPATCASRWRGATPDLARRVPAAE
ncbi:MAG: hypothetical protein ACRDTF_02325 [Pseudonocardiaceae bacterium]